METLLSKVKELEEVLIAKTNAEDERVAKNTTTVKANEELSIKLQAQETDLNAREEAVSGIESVVNLRAEAAALNDRTKKTLEDVRKEKENINKANKTAMDEQQAIKSENETESKRIIEDKKDLKKGWEQLRAKEASYKEDIKEQIGKKLD